MAFPAQVLQQAQYDASIGGKNMPKNAFQRAQGFIRSKLMPGAPTPNPSTMTPQQQTAFDAKQGGKAMKEYAKTKTKLHPSVQQAQGAFQGLLKGGGRSLGIGGGAVTGLSLLEAALEGSGTNYGKKITAGKRQEEKDIAQMLSNPLQVTNVRPKASGTVINIDGKRYDTGFHSKEIAELRKKNPGGGNAAQSTTEIQAPVTSNLTPSEDPRNADYLTARNALTKDSSAAEIQAVEDKGMAAWAKANPGLASKVKSGQSGYGLIQNMRGQGTDAYDANETFKPSDIPEADRQNPVEQAKARGITNLQDAQSFKNTAMSALLTASQNPNVTPIVEGMTIPTTTNYAGAFNQADMPDLQSMMNMGEELGSLGIEGPKFAQSQKFKDLFMNTMLSK